ncbi:uncharacterized protein [Palaemon carinicauda]|uniref:uncharacterized protein n=1 Tax=Palaemon carinicauda TaxID=392227 RepID=UPI0035B63CDB
MRSVSNRMKIWVNMFVLMVILFAYTHISVPIKFMGGYENSTEPSPPAMGSLSFRSSITDRNQETPESNQVKNGDYGKLPWWDGGDYLCDNNATWASLSPHRDKRKLKLTKDFGTCGRRAAADGDNQKVISFSLYGKDPEYWNGLPEILSDAKHLYPGWKVWIYTNPRNQMKILCPLLQNHSHLRICDVTNLPHPLNNITNVHPMFWRISPLGDPKVESLLVRDSDSKLTEREQKAVQEWLESGKTFHVMRDHPMHNVPILGGMWGANWAQKINENSSDSKQGPSFSRRGFSAKNLRRIRNQLFVEAFEYGAYGFDQVLLARLLWPSMKSVMVHDSFYCEVYVLGWRPWPTQRINGAFVGSPNYRKEYANDTLVKECTSACRPPDHPDWLYC